MTTESPEPINIFSRRIDPRGVVELLRRLGKRVRVAGPDDDWTQAAVTISTGFWPSRQLVFGHDANYYDGPDWPQQVFGIGNYFSGFPEVEIKPAILRAISQFRFAFSLPQCDLDSDGNDPRLRLVYAVCKHLDGMIFTPSALRDAAGRILIDAAGNSDPLAALPAIAQKTRHRPHLPMRRRADRGRHRQCAVAERAMVLAAVVQRGFLEREVGNLKKSQLEKERELILARPAATWRQRRARTR